MAYNTLLLDKEGSVGIVTLNRPDAMNALNDELMTELTAVIDKLEADPAIGCIVLTGSEKAFAAGEDVKELQEKSFVDAYAEDLITANWERVAQTRKPVIAAVAGYALGGGCELAMMCDFILAGDNAKFGLPEIRMGIIPGAGGTQRLARFIGKSKAMEMCLTGRMMEAAEPESVGLVSRVIPVDELRAEALKVATGICELSRPSVMMAKEAVNRSFETTLSEGIKFERRSFQSAFAFDDQKEGMKAFVEKRNPHFKNR